MNPCHMTLRTPCGGPHGLVRAATDTLHVTTRLYTSVKLRTSGPSRLPCMHRHVTGLQSATRHTQVIANTYERALLSNIQHDFSVHSVAGLCGSTRRRDIHTNTPRTTMYRVPVKTRGSDKYVHIPSVLFQSTPRRNTSLRYTDHTSQEISRQASYSRTHTHQYHTANPATTIHTDWRNALSDLDAACEALAILKRTHADKHAVAKQSQTVTGMYHKAVRFCIDAQQLHEAFTIAKRMAGEHILLRNPNHLMSELVIRGMLGQALGVYQKHVAHKDHPAPGYGTCVLYLYQPSAHESECARVL
ncbi:hypothetical protein SARC_14270 [Sphaeroforma arctica JP610]|uniref:Uncharacterized protein n=1 Tax=Sphaeroforma arctica JP610 TaxID=667725 RepID=A0A0L0F9G1_9EUKA|nr:hypothetical protein SARC_14270 [Sphaeroforma arctica JP610]KNC73171.1 hypothetical protein SARC_14270 [Sphaeroforma arctica JP610]|eukprot:XP_014147073.1 hypothetical protein SARC_14270 [Sphaeroforma arctica JP610]